MYTIRNWSVRHSRMHEILYGMLEPIFVWLHPLWNLIGYQRVDPPVAAFERVVKGFLFDCQMCGRCILSSTGMSCPMNCPKQLRNGPCGGVRADGHCEVEPQMRCVWVAAWEGSQRMRSGPAIRTVQFAVDHRWRGSSAWLRVARERAAERARLRLVAART